MVNTKLWNPKTCKEKPQKARVLKCGEVPALPPKDAIPDIETLSTSEATELGACGFRVPADQDRISVKSVSILNLEFPNEPSGKPILRMPTKLPSVSSDSIESCGQIFPRRDSSVEKRAAHFTFPVYYKQKKSKPLISEATVRGAKPIVSKKLEPPKVDSRPCYPRKGDMPKEERVPLPCDGSVIAGAPKPFVGVCPPNYAEIAKLSKEKQKFFLTEDPRKVRCLVNPEALRSKGYGEKREFETLTNMVKYADNLCDEEVSHSEENFICEIIDKENPMQLDFQGLDYKNTYEKDEQDITNQHVYRKVIRDMEKKRAKKDTANNVEDKLRKELLSLPKCFDIEDRNPEEHVSPASSVHLCKLYRAAEKPENKSKIAAARAEREERYRTNYLKKKEKNDKLDKERKEREKREAENLGTTLAIQHFNDANTKINEAIKRSFIKQTILKRKESVVRDFPHTIRETKKFKRELKQQNRVKRDRARLKMEYYAQMGKEKHYPEADLDISSSSRHENEKDVSTESSDDEDEIQVGRVGDQIKLRGFHFKLGATLRGKYHEREKREVTHRVRGCETREQWLKDLLPKRVTVHPDVYAGIEKHRQADDPNLILFHAEPYIKPKRPHVGSIQQYIKRRLGRHYEYDLRKNIKLVRPKLVYSVKKFNFIKYSFGKEKHLEVNEERKHEPIKIVSTKEYIEAKQKEREAEHYKKRKERLDFLGIPCEEIKRSRLETLCENSESSDSDWVPEKEEEPRSEPTPPQSQETLEEYYTGHFLEGGFDDDEESVQVVEGKIEPSKIPIEMRGNMPAPKYREPTLRINVHRPRDYHRERIPSALLEEVVPAHELPVLLKLNPPLVNFENVREPKRPYTKMLETRHHHDHWDPTDHPLVNVHYKPKIVKPKITEEKHEKRAKPEKFKKANPPCGALFEADLTLPDYKIKDMIAEHVAAKGGFKRKVQQEVLENRCQPYDYEYHSRPIEELRELDFPGRREYLAFLKEIRVALQDAREANDKKDEENPEERLAVDKDKVFDELEEDMKSIESCLTSMSSSDCTNLTNDSGSFLLLEGKSKLPLDYVRNALVPFEELQRSRFSFQVIDVEEEENNPFHTVPFAGQKKEQLDLSVAKDSFFTFTTRLRNGLRLRLEVPIEDVRKKLIGHGVNKYPGSVVTDVDENYVKMLENPPPVRSCKFKTGAVYIKDALRMKFESMLIQGQIVRTKIYDQLNDRHWANMQRIKLLYEKLFAKWKKHEYEAAMTVVYQVKSYYSKTDQLRNELHALERQYTQLNMDIVFLEAFWIRCIQLQNFHYLLADQEWRHQHDWIHRIYIGPEGESEDLSSEEEQRRIEMESFDVSIAKRPYINIRERDKDDAWAIKEYYYNVYLKNVHPILQVFPDHEAFLKGVDNLKAKTFVLLLEMHFSLSIHTELEGRLQTFQDWCALDLKNKREYVDRKCAKKYFMEKRAADIKKRTLEFLDKPIENSFNEPKILYNSAMILETWRKIVPAHLRGSEKGKKTSEMVAMIMEYSLELITRFEVLDIEKTKEIEESYRAQRIRQMKISQRAYQIEKRIEANMQKIIRNMQPAAKRQVGHFKPPRLVLKKKVLEEEQPTKQMSDHTKFFIRAFHDDGDAQLVDARESLIVIDNMQEQIVPFYFDHFLKLNGYTPNYNFKTQIELRDGPEVNRLQVTYVIPEVLQKVEQWEQHKKKVMEENIQRNPHMYINVI